MKNITQVPGELQVLLSPEGKHSAASVYSSKVRAPSSATHSQPHCTLSSVSSELKPWNLLPNFPGQPLILVSQLSACFSIPGMNVRRRSKPPCVIISICLLIRWGTVPFARVGSTNVMQVRGLLSIIEEILRTGPQLQCPCLSEGPSPSLS